MASSSNEEDIEYNPFYKALKGEFNHKFEEAQENCFTVCIPRSSSLNGVKINKEFTEVHVLRPSPLFRNQFMCTDKRGERTVRIEESHIWTEDGFDDHPNRVQILSEELGYNQNYKPYKILIIEKPINAQHIQTQKSGNQTIVSPIDLFTLRTTFAGNKRLLHSFGEHRTAILELNEAVQQFNTNYMLLQGYLDHASKKIQDICLTATKSIVKANPMTADKPEKRVVDTLANAVECYVLGCVHDKVFGAICQKLQKEDDLLEHKLKNLHGVTSTELGVKQEFSCSLPSALVELARLNGLCSPLEKLSCLKVTLDSISEEISSFVKDDLLPGRTLQVLTSDDLIPILVTVIIQARCQHLYSNVYYLENFHWASSSTHDLSFTLVTFKAAVEYLKATDFSYLQQIKRVKNEVSIDELIAETKKRWENLEESGETAGKQSTSPRQRGGTRSPGPAHTSFDRQLDNIARMMEHSGIQEPIKSIFGGELQVQRPAINPPDVVPRGANPQPQLGDFLSSLQDDDFFDSSYGKQD